MKKLAFLAALALAAAALAGSAFAGHKTTTVTVAMHDPGCHWFLVAGKYQKSLSVSGPVSLYNVDEAALRVMLPTHGMEILPVGKKVTLARGVYHITMVGQAPDDNHLLLVVR
ncbi:MAG TPA: hypothetical protein VFJ91_06650 [Gaiellaceae bacterium]|nr:hypothetical protein [Gaiellaceae bacterium]